MSNANDKTILVTGATGQQGGATARQLLAKGRRVRALTRKPEGAAAKALAQLGAEVVQGDLDDVASIRRALEGAWGVFAVQNTWEAGVEREEEQGKRIAELAREAGVQHYVYTSVGSAHRGTGVPHFDNKFRVEERVRSLGFPSHTIIRPAFFMENLLGPWFLSGDKLIMAVQPTTKLQMIAVEDIGKFGALAFERHEALNRAELDIAGDAVTLPEAARVLGEALGRSLTFVQPPIEEVRKAAGEDMALMLEWFDRVGYNADIPALKEKYGIPLQSFADWARGLPRGA